MRLAINLASRKYEDAREFYVRWCAALVFVLAATIGLGILAWSNHAAALVGRRHIDDLNRKIAQLDQNRNAAEAVLNRPENQDVRDKSRFWNNVIAEKSFSWTRLFLDLEKIMPTRAEVLSVEPKLTKDKRLQIKLTIGGEKHEDAVDLVRKMEQSEHFRFPELVREDFRQQSGKTTALSLWVFEIESYYTPATVEPPHLTAKEKR